MRDRTPQLLAARLEELSSVALRSGAAATAIASLLESASVATLHAIALDLLCGAPVQEVRALALERPVRMRLLDAA
jgi:2-methylcitrate dehydratase PrpD